MYDLRPAFFYYCDEKNAHFENNKKHQNSQYEEFITSFLASNKHDFVDLFVVLVYCFVSDLLENG